MYSFAVFVQSPIQFRKRVTEMSVYFNSIKMLPPFRILLSPFKLSWIWIKKGEIHFQHQKLNVGDIWKGSLNIGESLMHTILRYWNGAFCAIFRVQIAGNWKHAWAIFNATCNLWPAAFIDETKQLETCPNTLLL